jgi:very-short-patch-repair endonuclease
MSRNQTFPERLLWSRLRDKKLGVNFHKQKIVLGYILDFWCPRAGLAVEVDGPCHADRKVYDAHRDAVLGRRGILTMRFSAAAVNNNLAAVVALVADKMRRRMALIIC